MEDKNQEEEKQGDGDELDKVAGAESREDKGGLSGGANCDAAAAHAHIGEKLIDGDHTDNSAVETNHGNQGVIFDHDIVEVGAGLVDDVGLLGFGEIFKGGRVFLKDGRDD